MYIPILCMTSRNEKSQGNDFSNNAKYAMSNQLKKETAVLLKGKNLLNCFT